ncbi:barstar family protein [Streptomyces antibioticus]|nr:barstar family protein [Streptomyces antibioticus]MCX5169646.1 barstar family protein [Streptomyces antibioticus]
MARFYWAVPRLVNWCRTRLLVAPPVLVHVRNGTTTCKHVAVITIDVSEVTDERALHLLLMRELGFPGFYGMNLDAFWGSITGSGSPTMCASSAGTSSRPTFPAGPPFFSGRSTTTEPYTAQTSSPSLPSHE